MLIEVIIRTPEEDDFTYAEAINEISELLRSGYMEVAAFRLVEE